MTAIECLKVLRKTVCFLLVWNLLLTGSIIYQHTQKQEEKMNQQICNLECIPNDEVPQYELVEVE